ncbi:GNAT family N-acetyltransferase [Umezawaea beigongshangensis]|uniref:GNAT family N-acetyltransferase n=1 Tax=Umezawaea beigongshangensis TaxID=2780383 RepID=UPI0027DB7E36|nr:GNAT family N-acetyltransferase [Umezawaea beigongshangensis]
MVNADRVVELGLGERLDPGTVTAEELRAAVDRVASDPSVRTALDRVREVVRGSGGAARGADGTRRGLRRAGSARVPDNRTGSSRRAAAVVRRGAVRRSRIGGMTRIEVRPARAAEFAAVAGLRWRWVAEHDGAPGAGREEFVREFARWARENATTHPCLVLVDGEGVIGMGFLAVTARVPAPGALSRVCGDVQCVYVVPEARDGGLGGVLVEALLSLAAELGLERVTVHSSGRAVPLYRRHGFAPSPHLLQALPDRFPAG